MNIIQLEYFRAVMEYGSVTEAAGKLCVTQPAVSKQLRLLEEEFECRLFQRKKNHLIPTPAAEFLSARLQQILPGLKQIPEEMNGFQNRVCGKLRIGCGPYASAHMLPDLVTELLRRYPGIEPEISEKDSFMNDLTEGRLDIMIGVQKNTSKQFRYTPMIEGKIRLAASKSSPLAKMRRITRRELSAQVFLSYSFDPLRESIFRKMPFLRKTRYLVESRYAQTLLAYVQRNLGFAAIPEYSLAELPENVVILDYDTGMKNEIGCLVSAETSLKSAVKALLGLIAEKYPRPNLEKRSL